MSPMKSYCIAHPPAEAFDEDAGDADAPCVFRDFSARYPHGFGEFALLDADFRAAVKFRGEPRDERVRKAPGLARHIADVLHGYSRFFLHFARNGLLQAFAYGHETGDEVAFRVRIVEVPRHQEPVPVRDGDDHDG